MSPEATMEYSHSTYNQEETGSWRSKGFRPTVTPDAETIADVYSAATANDGRVPFLGRFFPLSDQPNHSNVILRPNVHSSRSRVLEIRQPPQDSSTHLSNENTGDRQTFLEHANSTSPDTNHNGHRTGSSNSLLTKNKWTPDRRNSTSSSSQTRAIAKKSKKSMMNPQVRAEEILREQAMGRSISKAIAIQRSPTTSDKHSDTEKVSSSLYDWATWRMYHRIVEHRQKHPVSAASIYEDEDFDCRMPTLSLPRTTSSAIASPMASRATTPILEDDYLIGEVFDIEV